MKSRLSLLLSIGISICILLCVLACVLLLRLATSDEDEYDESLAEETRRMLPEAMQRHAEIIDIIEEIASQDELLVDNLGSLYVSNTHPHCIRDNGNYRIYTSSRNYSEIISDYETILGEMRWESEYQEYTYFSTVNESMIIMVLPRSEFEQWNIAASNEISSDSEVYSVVFMFAEPSIPDCYLNR